MFIKALFQEKVEAQSEQRVWVIKNGGKGGSLITSRSIIGNEGETVSDNNEKG